MKWWDVRLNAPPSSPSCQSWQRDDYSLMPRRQGNEISCSSSRSFSFSISTSLRPSLWFVEAGRDFFFIVIARNILVWVSEAPTPLCGPRASLKFKEFPPTVHHFRLALYMVLAGGGDMFWLFLLLFFILEQAYIQRHRHRGRIRGPHRQI